LLWRLRIFALDLVSHRGLKLLLAIAGIDEARPSKSSTFLDTPFSWHLSPLDLVKRRTATIENIAPPTERNLGGVIVYLVEVKFRLDEQDPHGHPATQVCFEELDKVWGVSHDTGKLWQQDWSESVFPVENGVFVATLPADPGWKIGKRFSVLLPNVPE